MIIDVAQPGRDEPLLALMLQEPCTPVARATQPPAPAGYSARPLSAGADLDVPPEFVPIWSVLELHRGQATAITAPAIADAAGLWPDMAPANRGTRVRKVLELAQDVWPLPICGDADGYYVAVTPDELTHYCANLRSRALCCHRRFASVRNAGRRAGFRYLGHGRWAAKE